MACNTLYHLIPKVGGDVWKKLENLLLCLLSLFFSYTHFIFQLSEYPCNVTHGFFFFLICISRIFLEQKNDISRTFLEYPCNVIHGIFFICISRILLEQKIYTTDIFRTWLHFLRVNVTFYDAVNMIHDVNTTANSFPYSVKIKFIVVRNIKTQQIKRWKINRICT